MEVHGTPQKWIIDNALHLTDLKVGDPVLVNATWAKNNVTGEAIQSGEYLGEFLAINQHTEQVDVDFYGMVHRYNREDVFPARKNPKRDKERRILHGRTLKELQSMVENLLAECDGDDEVFVEDPENGWKDFDLAYMDWPQQGRVILIHKLDAEKNMSSMDEQAVS